MAATEKTPPPSSACPPAPVALVGAGPGDPELVTLAAARLLAEADVVVFDALVHPAVLDMAPPTAVRIDVGKRAGRHAMSQEQINGLLVELGRSGRRVVRLKGGDPFVFGRGGEEAEALADAGLDFVIVPGITAALAAAACAGIPVTHRQLASSVVLVTGHEDPEKAVSRLNFEALAGIDTVAFYMSVGRLAANADALIAAGKDPATPAALIERATWPTQRTVVAPLGRIAAQAEAAGIQPPAILLVGPTVALRDRLSWFEARPLFGRTFVVTRTRQQASALSQRLSRLGACVIEAATIRVEPPDDWADVDAELRRLGQYDWIVFTSANGVDGWAERMRALGLDGRSVGRARLAAIGPATAEALERLFLRADLVPETFVAEALADALKRLGDLAGKRVLLLRAEVARAVLPQALAQAGAAVAERAIYRTRRTEALPADLGPAVAAGKVDCVTFTSSSTVENFFALADGPTRSALASGRVAAACIGPVTSETFGRLAGRPADLVAAKHTLDGLVDVILERFCRHKG